MRPTSFFLGIWLLLAIYVSACSTVVRGYVQPKERSNMPVDPALDTLVKTFQSKKTGRTKFQVYSLNNKQLFVRQYHYQKDGMYWVSMSDKYFGKDKGYRYLYHPDGALGGVIPLVDGKAEGLAQYYHEGGNLEGEAGFKAGQYHGTMRLYWSTGQLYGELEYSEGRLMTVRGFFGPTGKPLNKGNFENGNGELWRYNNSGTRVDKIEVYKSGKLKKSKRAGNR